MGCYFPKRPHILAKNFHDFQDILEHEDKYLHSVITKEKRSSFFTEKVDSKIKLK
jgi:hypothetical protein